MTTHHINILYHHRTQGHGAEGGHIRGMVDGFRRLGCHVDILGPPGVDPYYFGAHGAKNKTDCLRNALSYFAESAPQGLFEVVECGYNFFAIEQIRRTLLQNSYQFIYERYALNSWAGSVLAAKNQIPLVIEVNDATIIDRSRPLCFTRLARKVERAVFSKARLIITITNYFKELIVTNYSVIPEKVLVLPNAIDPSHFDLTGQARISRTSMGISEKSIVIGCVGAFVPWHGLKFLVQSIGNLASIKNLFFLFIGDGPVRAEVLLEAHRIGVADRVHFTGFLPPNQVPLHLDLVDICVIPGSNAHCSPMKLFEYMAMGKPVVVPRYRPLLETIEHEKEGLFFAPNDSDGLRREILRLVESIELRQLLGTNARESVIANFIWDRNCARVIEALANLA